MSDTSYITLLPFDVLRAIGCSYRIWKLLQLCSPRLHTALGDYHTYHRISFCNGEDMVISYNDFVRSAIYHITDTISDENSDEDTVYAMYITGVANQHFNPDEHIPILTVSDARILIYHSGEVYQDLARYSAYEDRKKGEEGVCIHTQYYVRESRSYGTIKALYSWIFNELPALYSKIRVIRRITKDDAL